jgi:hypothetical protein
LSAFLNDHELSKVAGTMVQPLSVAQSRDESMTREYRGWQKLWQSGSFVIARRLRLMFLQHGFFTRLSGIGMPQQQQETTKNYFMFLWLLVLSYWRRLSS